MERALILVLVFGLLLAACQPRGEAFLAAKRPAPQAIGPDLATSNVRFSPGPSDMAALQGATVRFSIVNRGDAPATYTGFTYRIGEMRGTHTSDTPLGPGQSFDFEIPFTPNKVGPFLVQLVAGVYEADTGADELTLFFGHNEPDYDNNAYATTLHIAGPAFDCNDRLDNDEDGYADYPDDPGCAAYTDQKEYNVACADEDADAFRPNHQPGTTVGVPRAFPEETVQVADFCRSPEELIEYVCRQGWIEAVVVPCPCAGGACSE